MAGEVRVVDQTTEDIWRKPEKSIPTPEELSNCWLHSQYTGFYFLRWRGEFYGYVRRANSYRWIGGVYRGAKDYETSDEFLTMADAREWVAEGAVKIMIGGKHAKL